MLQNNVETKSNNLLERVLKRTPKYNPMQSLGGLDFDETESGISVKADKFSVRDVKDFNNVLANTRYGDKKGLQFAHHINDDGEISYGYVVFDDKLSEVENNMYTSDEDKLMIDFDKSDELYTVLIRSSDNEKKIIPSTMSIGDIMDTHNHVINTLSDDYANKVQDNCSEDNMVLHNVPGYFREAKNDMMIMPFDTASGSRLFVCVPKNSVMYTNNDLSVNLGEPDNEYHVDNVTYDGQKYHSQVGKMTASELKAYYDVSRPLQSKVAIEKDSLNFSSYRKPVVWLHNVEVDKSDKGDDFLKVKFGTDKGLMGTCDVSAKAVRPSDKFEGKYNVYLSPGQIYDVELSSVYKDINHPTLNVKMSSNDIKMCRDAFLYKLKDIDASKTASVGNSKTMSNRVNAANIVDQSEPTSSAEDEISL